MHSTPPPKVTDRINRLIPYRPGKPTDEVKRELGLSDVIKLASNENSLGPSPMALQAVREKLSLIHNYPDSGCFELCQKVADKLDVSRENLVFGNGSDDIIHLLGVTYLEPGDEVITGDPSFVRYEAAAILNQTVCHLVPLRNFSFDLDAMAARISDRTRIVFIANPNNPTGTIVTKSALEKFIARLPERSILVLDEAYYEYVESTDYPNVLDYVRAGCNVVALRTFSKAYGLAGLRIGYAIARPEIAEHLNRVREPFNVNLVAQIAAAAALDDSSHLQRTQEANRLGKRQLADGFHHLHLKYLPTEANFYWVDVGRDSREVFDHLLRAGVIVRTGDIFGAPNYIRVTIGTKGENERFLRGLESILTGKVAGVPS